MDPKQKQFSIWYVFIALWALMLIQIFVTPFLFLKPMEIPYSEFKAAVAAGHKLGGTLELHLTYDEEVGGEVGPKWLLDERLTRPDAVTPVITSVRLEIVSVTPASGRPVTSTSPSGIALAMTR